MQRSIIISLTRCLISLTLLAGCVFAQDPVEMPRSDSSIVRIESVSDSAHVVVERPNMAVILDGKRISQGSTFDHMTGLGDHHSVELWDLFTRTLRSAIAIAGRSFFAASGPKSLLAVRSSGGVTFYNSLTGAQIASPSVTMDATVGEGAFDAEGRYLYYEYYKPHTVTLSGIGIARATDGRVLGVIPAIDGESVAQHVAVSSAFGHCNTLVKADAQNRVLIRNMTTCWVRHE